MPKMVSCPQCGESCEYSQANRFRPFCSERCRLIDMGAWASESYRIAGSPLEPPASLDSQVPQE